MHVFVNSQLQVSSVFLRKDVGKQGTFSSFDALLIQKRKNVPFIQIVLEVIIPSRVSSVQKWIC
jgi:hypothetical protein